MINIKIKIIKFYEKENKEESFLKRGMTKRRPERRRELAVQTLRWHQYFHHPWNQFIALSYLSVMKKSYDQPRQDIKKQRHYFANKGPSSYSYGFSSGHVWIWQLDYKETWVLKNWCFWTAVLEKTLESSLDCKEIQPVHPKGDQSWVFIGRTDAVAETPIIRPPHAKSWLIWRPWCWERLKARGEGDDRGWDGWMASPTQWTWVWVNSRSWWWTGRPGVLRFMGLQRVRHDWATELNWTELMWNKTYILWQDKENLTKNFLCFGLLSPYTVHCVSTLYIITTKPPSSTEILAQP